MRKNTLLITAMLAGTMSFGVVAAPTAEGQQAGKNRLGDFCESSMPTRAGEEDMEIITSVPEGGESVFYQMTASGFLNYYGQISTRDDLVVPNDVVWFDNGDVYIKNPISQLNSKTYIKGHYANGVVTVDLPQKLYTTGGKDYYVNRMELRGVGNDSWYYVVREDNQVTYTVQEDKSMTLDVPPTQEILLGLSFNNDPESQESWTNYGDYKQEFETFLDRPLSLPDGVEAEEWVLLSEGIGGRKVNVAIDGNDVYMGNIYNDFKDSYVKGKIRDGHVVFGTGQYLGVETTQDAFTYFLTGYLSGDMYEMSQEIFLDYDAEAKTMKADKGDSMFVNMGADRILYYECFKDPIVRYQDDTKINGKPQTPIFQNYKPHDGRDSYIDVAIPMVDVDGYLLDTSRMTYSIFVDDVIFEFRPDEYRWATTNLRELDYDFTDWDMYDVFARGVSHTVYFYFDGAESFGVESYYKDEDGNVHASDRATFFTNKVEEMTAGEAVAVEYRNLAGLRVDGTDRGIYVKTTTYADGSRRSEKIVK